MKFREFLVEHEFRFEGDTVGIITAYNPRGEKSSIHQNRLLNKRLWNDLRAKGYDPWPVKGQYKGATEQSFVVSDISRANLVRFAKKYDQEAIVWGRKTPKGYDVEWIENGKTTKRGKITNIRSLISQSKVI